MDGISSNKYSHLTAKERVKLSFPAKKLMQKKLLEGRILDFGCGLGSDVEILRHKGYDVYGYDRYHFPQYPQGQFDTIICLYVLNVLLSQEQATVLMELSALLKPGGSAYFAVRRDLKREGYRIHKVHKKPTYQCNVKLPFDSLFKNDFCEIYHYTHINYCKSPLKTSCVFCQPEKSCELLLESATAYAILDKYPVSRGHTLIIPKRHVANYFDLTFREQSACFFMINHLKKIIDQRYQPDGYNIGININKDAGQTVGHVHVHLIPRYKGDLSDPEGGVRGVIPHKQKYTN